MANLLANVSDADLKDLTACPPTVSQRADHRRRIRTGRDAMHRGAPGCYGPALVEVHAGGRKW